VIRVHVKIGRPDKFIKPIDVGDRELSIDLEKFGISHKFGTGEDTESGTCQVIKKTDFIQNQTHNIFGKTDNWRNYIFILLN